MYSSDFKNHYNKHCNIEKSTTRDNSKPNEIQNNKLIEEPISLEKVEINT